MDNVFEDKKGFSFVTRKGTHFITYWNNISNEWNFVNLDTKCIEFKCEKDNWNTFKDFIAKAV